MSRSLLRSTATVGGFTLVSRILGFIRDVVVAGVFGAGAGMDAFLIAFKIPNFMRRLFAEGAFSQAFVPVLSEYKTQREPVQVRDLIDHVAGSLGSVLALITLVGVAASTALVFVFAPGFWHDPVKFGLTADMLRVTFPYLLLISLTAFAGAILNAYGRFAVPALTPILLNLSLIGAALWWTPWFDQPIQALAWGVLVAGLLQLLFQFPFLYRLQLLPRPRLNRHHEGVRRILKLMLPALFGVSVTQINLLVDTLLASFLVTGSVSWLYYSDRLLEFPVGIFGVALSTVMLPSLSRSIAQGQTETYARQLDWSLRWVFFLSLPCTAGLIALAAPILATLFYRGEFSAHDVEMSARSLVAFSVGLGGFVAIKVLASGFYARQDTRTPVRFGVVAMLTNIVLSLLLVWPLGLAHAGLALATACAALLNAGLLYRALRRQHLYQPQPGWSRFLAQVSVASLLMGLAVAWGASGLDWLHPSLLQRASILTLLMLGGVLLYALLLALFGLRPRHLLHTHTEAI